VQALPLELRRRATASVSHFVAPGGTLLVISAGRSDDEVGAVAGPPWPLNRAEIDAFAGVLAAIRICPLAAIMPRLRR
jgi:hypothetical protein